MLGAPSAIVLSPNQEFVFVACQAGDGILVYSRKPSTGLLSYVEVIENNTGGIQTLLGVNTLAFDPTGTYLFATGYDTDAITVFIPNPTTGLLTYVQSVHALAGAV